MTRTVGGRSVGGWLLKANPAVWDVEAHLDQDPTIDRWRLARTYRAELVEPGDWCGLWLTGPRGGLLAVGTVIARPHQDLGDAADPLWLDRAARDQERPYLPLDLDALPAPFPRAVFRSHPVLRHMEVLQVPRAPNPVVVTPEELAELALLLP